MSDPSRDADKSSPSIEPSKPTIKIGSQRDDSPPIEAKPQIPSKVEKPKPAKKTPVPSTRGLSPELELEIAEAMGEMSLDEALQTTNASATLPGLEPESRHRAKVVSIHRDDVFVDLGGRSQGVLSLRSFAKPPEPGAMVEVVVQRFNSDDGLYQVTMPGGAVDVGDWSSVVEGAVVEARVSGHNKGGLECEVSSLRGFIPASQIATYRVEDLAQFVGQKLACLVTEVNAERRRLVLSRRAVLEREQAAAKQQLMGQLAEGQVREGTVRSLQDFGAFVDLGGVDGLLHVSQLSWQRVKHPSDVLSVGQRVKVVIRKIDAQTGKLSLGMRDLLENPWQTATMRYPVTSNITGKVTKIMDFGAFVELEPGIEGLVHISELSHGRVNRVRDAVKEGDEVEAKILSIDPDQQRISLSMKAIQGRPDAKSAEPEADEPAALPLPKSNKPLKGGVGRASGGEAFGLKW